MTIRTLFATLLVLFYSTFVHANDMFNGNGYWAECQKESHYCLGFLEGLAHGTAQTIDYTVMSIYPDENYDQFDAHRQSLTMFCIPEKVTMGQMLDVFLKYLKDNPNKRDRTTGHLYMFAMRDAFPCAPTK